jgi:hypothetical protein
LKRDQADAVVADLAQIEIKIQEVVGADEPEVVGAMIVVVDAA